MVIFLKELLLLLYWNTNYIKINAKWSESRQENASSFPFQPSLSSINANAQITREKKLKYCRYFIENSFMR